MFFPFFYYFSCESTIEIRTTTNEYFNSFFQELFWKRGTTFYCWFFSILKGPAHCCWFERLQVDCSIQISFRRCRPVTTLVAGFGRCPGNNSSPTSLEGRGSLGPVCPSAGSAAWWTTELQERGDPGPVLSGPPSPTACSSPWTGYGTLSGGRLRHLAVG